LIRVSYILWPPKLLRISMDSIALPKEMNGDD
jgi:hypothetical protein